jgi:hypothetical protein
MIRFYFALIQITATLHIFTFKSLLTTRHKVWSWKSVVISARTLTDFNSPTARIALLIAYCLPPWSVLISWMLLILHYWLPPWSRFLAYQLGDTFLVQGFAALASVSVAVETQQFCHCWLGNFLGNGLSIYSLPKIASYYSVAAGTRVWEPLRSNGRTPWLS